VVRFWRSRGDERQQMKWITYAAGIMFTMVLLVTVLDVVAANSALAKVANPLTGAMFAGIPVAVGIAVLKYRLYDIDRIINRTLVYGTLTVMLAAVYFGGVTATQALFQLLTGQEEQPQLAIVVSTLVIAALFNPLRRRVQAFMDRRFYRSKYDATQTLAGFSAKLRDETDLEALNSELVRVVRETMQPAHLSLWLHPDPALKDKKRAAIRESGREEE
jgi:divalent metal cation (Fe/Co/Zn/Cd) transporter